MNTRPKKIASIPDPHRLLKIVDNPFFNDQQEIALIITPESIAFRIPNVGRARPRIVLNPSSTSAVLRRPYWHTSTPAQLACHANSAQPSCFSAHPSVPALALAAAVDYRNFTWRGDPRLLP